MPDGNRNRLQMYCEGAYIGEYEHSIDKHIDAKREEADLLLDAYRRYGKIAVRWNGSERIKEIRTYQEGMADPGCGGAVVGLIPKAYWTKR